jgi:Rrf2 family iron-sulfur cluster assembly transcriptional regulator
LLSNTSRYAVRLLGFLVAHSDERVPVPQIAEATVTPANYVSKILNAMRKHGLVVSERGWGGGFQLAPGVLDRPIRDVVVLFDGVEKTNRTDCGFGLPKCNPANPCPLHVYWSRVQETVQIMLDEVKVRDLAGSRV